MDDVYQRAWKYYQRNGWRRSMKMLRRKIAGTALPPNTYMKIFNGIGESVAAPDKTASRAVKPAGRPVAPIGPIFRNGIVAIIGDLNLPQCKKYRVIQKVECLNAIGMRADYSYWGDMPRSLNIMQCASAVIFYRMKDSSEFKSYLAEARRLGIPAGYDIDDPIFDKAVYGSNPNLQFLKVEERTSLLSETESYRQAMDSCDFVIASTPGMMELARLSSKSVYLWRNAVDAETRHWGEVARNRPSTRAREGIVLGYASGSRAHEADFRMIEEVLPAIFGRFKNLTLAVNGYLKLPQSLSAYGDRIVTAPFTNYAGYLAGMAQLDINLVPLVADRFNECKSAIRYLDAAVAGVPTVASKVGDFVNVVSAGRTGVLVTGKEEWIERLSDLVKDKTLRQRMGQEARHSALTECSTAAIGQGLDRALQSRLGKIDA